jgi:hypothetical protein
MKEEAMEVMEGGGAGGIEGSDVILAFVEISVPCTLSTLYMLSHLVLMPTLSGLDSYDSHFTDEEVAA